jgi:hypothetical protein
MISVFSVLNLAPEALHQWSRVSWTVSNLSVSLRKRVVSSANIAILGFLWAVGMFIPLICGLFLILHASGSMARSNSAHESGSPCQTPCCTGKGSLNTLLMDTLMDACWYNDLTIVINGCGMWNTFNVSHR